MAMICLGMKRIKNFARKKFTRLNKVDISIYKMETEMVLTV